MQDQLTLPHRQQLLIHRSCRDEKALPISQRRQDERDEHVHSQELLTAELTSRLEWVRIIHGVQTFAVTIRKTAGPGLSFQPFSVTYAIEQVLSQLHEVDTPLTANHKPRQFTVISSLHHQWEL
ncbi:hypothetical protein VZT92_024362 [Zoarces viviparus]|uniref:Uncharacterized protein n=1 Tax=Zoarces viviparus TaxID=48416 RepID=A0AAW1E305_ZOAVI